MIRNNVVFNTLYMLPLKGNRLVQGWQLGAVETYHTGTPIIVTDGIVWAFQNGTTANRPDLNAGLQSAQQQSVQPRRVFG